jgi:hypothetical protein
LGLGLRVHINVFGLIFLVLALSVTGATQTDTLLMFTLSDCPFANRNEILAIDISWPLLLADLAF